MTKTAENPKITPAIGAAALLLSLVLVLALFRYFNFPASLIAAAVLAMGYLILRVSKIRSRRLFANCAVFSCLISASFIIGGLACGAANRTLVKNMIYWAALSAAFFFFSSWAANAILNHPIKLGEKPRFAPGKVWLLSTVLLFVSWIPCLFVYYPGSVSPDSLACIVRAVGIAGLSNQQPVAYILLMRPFFLFAQAIGKDLNFGAALFLMFQTVVMAVMTAYLIGWETKKKMPLLVMVLTLAYFILNPVFPLYSCTMWKDVLFGALVLLYVLNVFDIVYSNGGWLKSRRNFFWFLLLNLLVAFLRNNGYFIIFVTLAVIFIMCRKNWKRLLPGFLAVLMLVPIVQGPIYSAFKISPSPFAESVGIPLQQIGYTVVHNGKITDEQKQFLNQLLPLDEMKKAYQPHSSNGIKFDKQFNDAFLEKNKLNFLKIWAQMLPANLKSYVNAYGWQTYGYWHIGTTNWTVYDGIGEGYGAQGHGLFMSDPLHMAQNRPVMQKAFQDLQQSIPILSGLVSIATLFWISVFAACILIIRRKGRLLLALLPLLILWGTLMLATPVYCEFRYMFAFAMALPATVLFAFPVREPVAEKPAAKKPAAYSAQQPSIPDETKANSSVVPASKT